MSREARSPQQLRDQEALARRLINEEHDLSQREKAVLNVVLDWSLLCGKEWAIFDGWELFGGLAGLERTHVSSVVTKLQADGLMHCTKKRGHIRARVLPQGTLLPPLPKIDPKLKAEFMVRARQLNALPDGFDPDGQRELDLKTPEERLDDDQAKASREHDRSEVAGGLKLSALCLMEMDRSGHEDGEKRTDSVHFEPNKEGAGAARNVPNRYVHGRAPAQAHTGAGGHVMRTPTEFMSHDSERGGAGGAGFAAVAAPPAKSVEIPWGSLHEDLLNDIFEACEPTPPSLKQEREWRARILRDPRSVREAIMETSRFKQLGKLTNPERPGGFLNVVYLDISGEQRKAKPWERVIQ